MLTCTDQGQLFFFWWSTIKNYSFLLVCLQSVINTIQFITAQCTLIFKVERIEQKTSRSSSKERKKEIECLSLLSQGLNASKVSFERSQNMLYSLKANKNHVQGDHISLARPHHNGLNFFLNNLEENNYVHINQGTFVNIEDSMVPRNMLSSTLYVSKALKQAKNLSDI